MELLVADVGHLFDSVLRPFPGGPGQLRLHFGVPKVYLLRYAFRPVWNIKPFRRLLRFETRNRANIQSFISFGAKMCIKMQTMHCLLTIVRIANCLRVSFHIVRNIVLLVYRMQPSDKLPVITGPAV